MDKWEVIIPCWIVNEEILELTKNTIDSLGKVDLIIIDNASSIGGGFLRSVAKTYIRNNENLGYAKAVNQGLVLSHLGSYIAIANNDIRVSPNWKEVTKEVFTGNNKVYSCHFRMTDYDIPFQYGNQTWYTGRERWCSSSFFVLNNEGGYELYDEEFLNSYEDWDYWKRVRDLGAMTAYTTKACYQHKHSSSQVLVPERFENNLKNEKHFKEKHGEYAEVLFDKQYPKQMTKDYWQVMNEL